MYRNENPMQYRRNAISITPQRMRTGSNERTSDDLIYVPDGKHSRESRLMSVSDETSGLRVRNVLSRFSLNADEDGPSNSTSAALGSRITQAQIEGRCSRHHFQHGRRMPEFVFMIDRLL